MLPNSVLIPVRITNAFALPLTTCDPMNNALALLANTVSAGNTPTCFSTGNVSPVNAASSINNSFDSINRQSAGTISPASRMITSPGTISSIGISPGFLSRITFDVSRTIASNCVIALPAAFSCQKPNPLLIKTIAIMIIAFVLS